MPFLNELAKVAFYKSTLKLGRFRPRDYHSWQKQTKIDQGKSDPVIYFQNLFGEVLLLYPIFPAPSKII